MVPGSQQSFAGLDNKRDHHLASQEFAEPVSALDNGALRSTKNRARSASGMRLADKIALITGGGRGVGRVIALTFAREGADVAICARTENELRKTAAEVEQLGRRCLLHTCDVTVNEQCVATVREAMRHFGRIDILVNNAGGGDVARHSRVGDADDAWWFDNIALNLHSTFFFCRAVLPHM